ncbi:MAG TPA: choice-of-anchor Q domain-containing protein [Rudaea sp.]|jgi:predicted outer membrane repeat protein|nr:choice-of-anchor Q domain-containing protein [Rudaea sp.]
MHKRLQDTNLGTRAALAAAVLLGSPAAGASPLAAGVLAHYIAVQALAANRSVTSCADDGSAGTLRAVIALAGSGDSIDLSGLPSIDPACIDSTITLTQGEIAIPHNLTLQGPADATLTIAAGGHNRVLNSTSTDLPNAYLQITSLTISGGGYLSNHVGGCIMASGEVRLDGATVTDCFAYTPGGSGKYLGTAAGGGIFADSVTITNGSVVSGNTVKSGTLSLLLYGGGVYSIHDFSCTDSTISGNSAFGHGGGISAGGNISLTRCTLDSNLAAYGGGVFVSSTTALLQVDQSTISGNTSSRGGGINTRSPATISNSTIAFNSAQQSYGGGIQSSANVAMVSTIVARNRNDSGANADIALASGKSLSGSNNLVMAIASFPPGVVVSASDPLLAPLGMRGGPTRTHALLAASPAIDAGGNSRAFATDQRGAGFAREVPTGKPDIGAYERQLAEDEIFGNGFE